MPVAWIFGDNSLQSGTHELPEYFKDHSWEKRIHSTRLGQTGILEYK